MSPLPSSPPRLDRRFFHRVTDKMTKEGTASIQSRTSQSRSTWRCNRTSLLAFLPSPRTSKKRRRKWEKVRKSSYVGGRIYRQLQRLKALPPFPPPRCCSGIWLHQELELLEEREGKGRELGKGCGSGWKGKKLEEKGEREQVVVASSPPRLNSPALRRPCAAER